MKIYNLTPISGCHCRVELELKAVVTFRSPFPGMSGIFIPREKERGIEAGGTDWDFWEQGEEKLICEAEVPPCD